MNPQALINSGYSEGNLAALGIRNPEKFSHQRAVIYQAWHRLWEERASGIVLADEVGLGKTYEALWTAYLGGLTMTEKSPAQGLRILFIIPPKLVTKWTEEMEGFAEHIALVEPALPLALREASAQFRMACLRAKELEVLKGAQGTGGLLADRRPVKPGHSGIYLLKATKLAATVVDKDPSFKLAQKQFRAMQWDIVCFDEAHQYAKGVDGGGSKRGIAARTFCASLCSSGAKILLCTATPFQLNTHELENLISLVNSSRNLLEGIRSGIDTYNHAIEELQRVLNTPEDNAGDAEKAAAVSAKEHLESILKPWIVRSRRAEHEGREVRQHDVHDVDPGREFPWVYWRVKDWLRLALTHHGTRTFLPTTLHMTLSSRQSLQKHIKASKAKRGGGDQRLKSLTSDLMHRVSALPSHPKMKELRDFVDTRIRLAVQLIEEEAPDLIQAKCVVFSSYTETIRAILSDIERYSDEIQRMEKLLRSRAEDELDRGGINVTNFRSDVEKAILSTVSRFAKDVPFDGKEPLSIWDTTYEAQTDLEFTHLHAVKQGYGTDLSLVRAKPGRSLRDHLVLNLKRRFRQPVQELEIARRVLRRAGADPKNWQTQLQQEVGQMLDDRLKSALTRIHRNYFGGDNEPDHQREWLRFRLSRLVFAFNPRKIAEALMGETDMATRQQIINSFNADAFPVVLVCSSVAEEGIDLQKQCNTVIHYDLEWNPAKVEQREGRVDRLGGSEEVQVHFKKLKGTYDERIYHRFNARRIWMDLYLCSSWIEEGKKAEEETADDKKLTLETSATQAWLQKCRLDLRPPEHP